MNAYYVATTLGILLMVAVGAWLHERTTRRHAGEQWVRMLRERNEAIYARQLADQQVQALNRELRKVRNANDKLHSTVDSMAEEVTGLRESLGAAEHAYRQLQGEGKEDEQA